MSRPTTPPSLTDKHVLEFCRSISPHSKLIWVRPKRKYDYQAGHCFPNVLDYTSKNGGEVAFGWIIWFRPGVFIEAENHAVVRLGKKHLDPTPAKDGEQRLAFWEDASARPKISKIGGHMRGLHNKHMALTDDPVIHEWIAAKKEQAPLADYLWGWPR